MKVRETIGTTVRDDAGHEGDYGWGPASGHGEYEYRNMGERRTATSSVREREVRDSVVTTCAVMVYASA